MTKRTRLVLILLIVSVIGAVALFFIIAPRTHTFDFIFNGENRDTDVIRYIAVGDSYTQAAAIDPSHSWPRQLTAQLNNEGVAISLVATYTQPSWTSQDVIDEALPFLADREPDLISIQVGRNDWINHVQHYIFRERIAYIMDQTLELVSDPAHVLVMTIPDFSAASQGHLYGSGRDIPQGVSEFNAIIKDEANQRALTIIDIFDLSQEMRHNPELVAPDGLHPSAAAYTRWMQFMLPIVKSSI